MTTPVAPLLATPAPIDSMQATLPLRRGLTPSSTHVLNWPEADGRQNSAPVEQAKLCKADIVRDDLTGLGFGPYVLGQKLGGGGMGKIFVARHVHLDREFALKFIVSDATHCVEASRRFDQEVKALGKLQHPNIVSAVDAGTIDGMQYLATERIQGQDLWQIVKWRGALSIADACEMIRQAALGLAYSHSCGILHRDIKPSNLIVDHRGVVKILDFGLVRKIDSEQLLTMDGVVLGTLDFIAPEQAQDARTADQRSDLYSLGCTLVYLLSGHPPFCGERYATPASKLKGHLLDTPDWLTHASAELPAPLQAILRRLLAKDPGSRFATAQEVAEVLAPFCVENQLGRIFEADASRSAAAARDLLTNRRPTAVLSSRRNWTIGASIAIVGLLLVSWGAVATWRGVAANVIGPIEPQSTAANQFVGAPILPPAEERRIPTATIAEPQPAPPATATTARGSESKQTSEPRQTVNASAIPFKFSASPPKVEFQPIAGQATGEP